MLVITYLLSYLLTPWILSCVIPLVLSNNNNKLMVHSQNTTIFTYNTFTINKVHLHVSAINGSHLQVVHEALNDKLYLPREWVCRLWDGVGARSRFCVCKGCGSGLLKYRSSLLITISTSRLHFDVCCLILKKLYKLVIGINVEFWTAILLVTTCLNCHVAAVTFIVVTP
jgi:hypothetical protein